MAQFYTLDEAASRLGMPVDDLKRKLKTDPMFTAIRPFRDGATLQFRAADIDELARSLGAASDPGFGPGVVSDDNPEDRDDFIFTQPTEQVEALSVGRFDDKPLVIAEDDEADDIFTPAGGRDERRGDSDIRLDLSPPMRPYESNPENLTDEISLDFDAPGSATIKPSGLSGKLTTGKSGRLTQGQPGNIPNPMSAKSQPPADTDSSSEFELSLDPDSDSVELNLAGDSSDEVDLGGYDRPAKSPGQSGINLTKPADSGLSLEKPGKKTGPLGKSSAADDESDEFDLSLDLAGPSSVRLPKAGPKTGPLTPPAAGPNSDSEFELSIDDNSGIADAVIRSEAKGDDNDVYATDFEIPAMDDESAEFSAVESDSDEFEVTSEDEVELVEDEGDDILVVDDDAAVAPVRGRREVDDALDDDFDAVPASRTYDRDPVAGPTVIAPPAEWGPLPAIVLLLTMPLLFLGTLMSYEVVRGSMGYQNSASTGSALVRGVATSLLGEKLAD